jgi:hypothetical protein
LRVALQTLEFCRQAAIAGDARQRQSKQAADCERYSYHAPSSATFVPHIVSAGARTLQIA